jgi:transposase
MVTTPGELLSGKTAWARRVQSPLREFLRTESGGAAVLLAAAVAALVWVNVDASSYQELVWRHLPLTDVHPHAQLTAEASEAATDQGAFWEMHDLLLEHQDALRPPDLIS